MRRHAGVLEARIAAARAKKPTATTDADADADSDAGEGDDEEVLDEGALIVANAPTDADGADGADGADDVVMADGGAAEAGDDPRYGSDPRYTPAGQDFEPCSSEQTPGSGVVADIQPRSAVLVVAHNGNFSGFTEGELDPKYRAQFEAAWAQQLKTHEERLRRNPPKDTEWTPEDIGRRKNYLAGQIHEQRYLNKPLPRYRTWARSLKDSEQAELDAQRKRIAQALLSRPASQVRGAKEACEAVQEERHALVEMALELPDDANDEAYTRFEGRLEQIASDEPQLQGNGQAQGLVRKEAYAEVARAPLLTEPVAYDKETLVELAEYHDVPREQMEAEYLDFMNDARRRVLSALSAANAAKLAEAGSPDPPLLQPPPQQPQLQLQLVPTGSTVAEVVAQAPRPPPPRRFARATRAELDAWMEEDEEAEYVALFERETDLPLDSGAVAAAGEGDGAWAPTDMGTVKSCAGCAYERINWSATFADKSQPTEAQEAAAEAWVKEWNGRALSRIETPLYARNQGTPCAEWDWPQEGEPGYWWAAKRIVELKAELNIKKRGGPDIDWYELHDPDDPSSERHSYNAKWSGQAPVQITETANGRTRSLMDQIVETYWQRRVLPNQSRSSKFYHNDYTANNMRLSMLRCFPGPRGRLGFEEIGELLEFVCWWHENITGPGTRPKAADSDQERVNLFYRIMCAPNLRGGRPRKDAQGNESLVHKVNALATAIHTRVGIICHYYNYLKQGLDMDVFQVPPSQSLLLNGGGMVWMALQAELTEAEREAAWAGAVARAAPDDDEEARQAAAARQADADASLAQAQAAVNSGPAEPSARDRAKGKELYERWRRLNPIR